LSDGGCFAATDGDGLVATAAAGAFAAGEPLAVGIPACGCDFGGVVLPCSHHQVAPAAATTIRTAPSVAKIDQCPLAGTAATGVVGIPCDERGYAADSTNAPEGPTSAAPTTAESCRTKRSIACSQSSNTSTHCRVANS
jgi:hypothetical protein